VIDEIPFSREAKLVFAEAADIARRSEQPMDSVHLILGLFAVRCEAQSILLEKRVDYDRILEVLPRIAAEPPETISMVYSATARIAGNVGSHHATSVHLLMAISRITTSRAARALEAVGLPTFALRTQAMAHLTDPRLRRSASERIDVVGAARGLPGMSPGTQVPQHSPQNQQGGWLPGHTPRPSPPSSISAVQPMARPKPSQTVCDDDLPIVFDEMTDGLDLPLDSEEVARIPAAEPLAPRQASTSSRWDLDMERYPTLNALGRNLNVEACAGRIDPLVGRDAELDAVVDILCKRRSNNPMLLGDPGVGKTALVEGLAALIVRQGDGLQGLSGRIIVSISVADLVAGTVMRGAFAARLRAIKDEVLDSGGRVILFIDEIHTLIGAGAGDGGMDAANDLKGALARGELPCIGATTFGEYKHHILTDAALKRRFEPVFLREPSLDDAETILAGVAPRYASYHGVTFSPDALRAAVRLTDRLIPDRSLPAKAIDVLDRAGARVRRDGRCDVGRDDVVKVLSALVDLPREYLALSPTERLREMERFLADRVFGHDEALAVVVRTLSQNWSRFGSRRPLGSFVLAGPAGSGRHTLAASIAEFLFGTAQALLEIDLTDYAESHSLSHLVGSPPGYVGHEDGGLLADTLVRRPFLVILWRHPEAAHPSIQGLLGQILSDGTVTDRRGRRMDFRNTVHILAPGASDTPGPSSRPVGFEPVDDPAARSEALLVRLRKTLPSDLLSSIDACLPFPRPTAQFRPRLLGRLLTTASLEFRDEHGIRLEVDSGVASQLVSGIGASEAPGAALEAALSRRVLRPAADMAFASPVPAGAVLRVCLPADGSDRFLIVIEPCEPA
jgi:ATP-dependent Clp protease ATP-binding subunit ClpC